MDCTEEKGGEDRESSTSGETVGMGAIAPTLPQGEISHPHRRSNLAFLLLLNFTWILQDGAWWGENRKKNITTELYHADFMSI